ncbi:hypothetical protein EJ06DRAFT_125128 [Trichodelitschia bisporula]|uniref:Uncharacterized protein n=1 Tax=Trichodelitschia bisporula TaxID=703511 RepID=A0A6G1HQ82_9PEZI|nr:hypothetical protein EJ06DRAFT_125128 [Trichodelitschia bisporula]
MHGSMHGGLCCCAGPMAGREWGVCVCGRGRAQCVCDRETRIEGEQRKTKRIAGEGVGFAFCALIAWDGIGVCVLRAFAWLVGGVVGVVGRPEFADTFSWCTCLLMLICRLRFFFQEICTRGDARECTAATAAEAQQQVLRQSARTYVRLAPPLWVHEVKVHSSSPFSLHSSCLQYRHLHPSSPTALTSLYAPIVRGVHIIALSAPHTLHKLPSSCPPVCPS